MLTENGKSILEKAGAHIRVQKNHCFYKLSASTVLLTFITRSIEEYLIRKQPHLQFQQTKKH